MAIIFQYGSNMSIDRLNSEDRLKGDAKFLKVARTVANFELDFTVWSENNDCAAADIRPNCGRTIYGVLYDIPDSLIYRASAKQIGRKSMDAIEGEGTNYVRKIIEVMSLDSSPITAITYVVKDPKLNLQTSFEYVSYILKGAEENNLPKEYRAYLKAQILKNNPSLKNQLEE